MLRSSLQNCTGRNLVVQDHGAPTGRFPLGADEGTELNLTPLLQNLSEDFHLSFVCTGVEQEVIQDFILVANRITLQLV